VRHEAPGDQGPGDPARFRPEGRLNGGGGRSYERPPRHYRLKRSIEIYPAPDHSIHLINDGIGSYFLIPEPTESDRLVLDLLRSGFLTRDQIADELMKRGLETGTLDTSLTELTKSGHLETRTGDAGLDVRAAERFDRQLIYFSDICPTGEGGELLQMKLREAKVVILGCGGLGSWAACGLVCAGIGDVTLIDDDTVELSNLNRQLLFKESDIGTPKVEAAALALSRYDSTLRVTPVRRRVESAEDVAELIDGADLLVATADWPPYELPRWINQASLETGVPYLTAGQFPPLIRIGPMVIPGRTSCLECQERAVSRDYPMYDELADFRSGNPTTASTLGAASGMIGSIIAMEAIHLLTGAVDPATLNRVLLMDLRTMESEYEAVTPEPDCVCSRIRVPVA